MECVVEGALKSSFTRGEMVVKLTEDLLTLQNHHFPTDDFFVDDLLDFSKVDDQDYADKHINQTLFMLPDNEPLNYNYDNHPQLYVPEDDVEDLEWLSNFVDESSTAYSLTLPAGELSVKPFVGTPVMTGSEKPVVPTSVQTKARSKRARTGFRVWSLGSHSFADSSSSSTSSSTITASLSPSLLCESSFGQSGELVLGKPEVKKQKRKVDGEMTRGGGAFARRCSHCHVTKTPQWRTGPLGAKTLCNACGVRFKSGRLFPEYRPACSPTFSSEIHSNSHRKVLEMRRNKEGGDGYGSMVLKSYV